LDLKNKLKQKDMHIVWTKIYLAIKKKIYLYTYMIYLTIN